MMYSLNYKLEVKFILIMKAVSVKMSKMELRVD